MSGRRVHAAEARGMSLCDAVVPDDRLGAAALERASALAEAAPLGVQAVKSALRPELDAELAATLAAELEHQTRLKGTADFAEGMRAARDRSRPVFSGR
jgi:enoyl-CoA hydratase/carnithine racemase